MNKSIAFLILTTLQVLLGQIPSVKHFSTSNGLVNNDVNAIYEDRNGYIWFATMGGISKWDGINFENFTQNNGLPYFQVFDIYEDEDGKIYFATFGKSIVTYFNGILDTIDQNDGFETKFAWRIIPKKNGDIYFCGADETITIFANGEFKLTDFKSKVIKSTINTIFEGEHGTTLFGTTEYGIVQLKNDSSRIYDYGFNKHIWKIENIGTDSLLVGTKKGLYLLNTKSNKAKVPKWSNVFQNEVLNIHKMKDGKILILASEGVYIKDSHSLRRIKTLKDDLSGESFFERKNGDLIIGGVNGFYIFNPNKIELVELNGKSITEEVYDVVKDKNGKLIITTPNGIHYQGNENFYSQYKLPSHKYTNLLKQNNNNIIFSTPGNGAFVFNYNNFSQLNDQIGFNENIINYMNEIGNDTIAFGLWRGVSIWSHNYLTNLKVQDGLASEFTTSILKAKDGKIYYGSHGNGLTIFYDEKINYLNIKNGLSDNVINCLLERSDGAILIGTQQAGLNILRYGLVDTITTKDGLTSNNITALGQDKLGNIYAATTGGLNIINFNDRDFLIRTVTEEEGLAGNDCNLNSIYIDDENNVFVGTKNGLTKYNPIYDNEITSPPPIYIIGLEIFNKPQDLGEFKNNPNLFYDENYLKFSFIGINLSAPHKTVYQYKLSGVDKDWVESKNNNVQYTSLDDGNYSFEVKARNEWGYWSEPAKLAFVINPAWWETWWFYSLSVLAVGSLIAFISSYRYRHLLAIEKMRSKISADLHDSVGSGLSEISILTELLKFQVPEDKIELKSGLGNVSTISRTLVESMGDIVWLVNPKKDTLKDLFKRLQLSYHEVLKHTDVDLIIENLDELENIKLPMDFRQHLYLIFKEAINNAIKYSNADLLTLNIQTNGNSLIVTFSDNGKGFDVNQEKMGNGLVNMQTRSKEIGGIIEYFSEPNKGTKIIFKGKFNRKKNSLI